VEAQGEGTKLVGALRSIEVAPDSALHRAFAAWYPELKKMAHARLLGTGLQGSVQTTALVHDSYVKLADGREVSFGDRLQFLAYASRVLRSIIVDLVREQRALRRGGDAHIVTLDTGVMEGLAATVDVETVNDALEDLAKIEPALARLVEMRFFGGMSEEEIAAALEVSPRTVSREWRKARALLLTLVGE
jgi:RNA polymerase sigma factor (TIGR02999 family)